MKILDYIFCDDIRFEIRGKYSLIGLYHDSINIETKDPALVKWPIGLRVGVLVRVRLEGGLAPKKEASFRFELKYNSESCGVTEGTLAINDTEPVIIALPMGPFTPALKGPGDFSFELKITQDNQDVALLESPFSLPVRIRQVS